MARRNKQRKPPQAQIKTAASSAAPQEVVYEELRMRQGPLPDPAEIQRYDELISNGADRIMAQWEAETAHRHKMQSRHQILPFYDQIAGRIIALVFSFGCLAVAAFAISYGMHIVAGIFGGAMIISGIRAFLKAKG